MFVLAANSHVDSMLLSLLALGIMAIPTIVAIGPRWLFHIEQSRRSECLIEHSDGCSRIPTEMPLVGVKTITSLADIVFLIVDEVMPRVKSPPNELLQ